GLRLPRGPALVARIIHPLQSPPQIINIAGKKEKPEKIIFIVQQQDRGIGGGNKNSFSHHFLAKVIREKTVIRPGFDLCHARMSIRQRLKLKFHEMVAVSRRFFLKRSPCNAPSTNLIRTGIWYCCRRCRQNCRRSRWKSRASRSFCSRIAAHTISPTMAFFSP